MQDTFNWMKICKSELAAEITAIFPRRYSMPGWAHDPEELAVHATTNQTDGDPYNAQLWKAAAVSLIRFGSRVYAVEPNLIQALQRTRLDGASMAELHWPLPAFALVLPRGGIQTDPLSGDLTGVIVAEVDHAGRRNVVICGGLANGGSLALHQPIDRIDAMAGDLHMPHGGDKSDVQIELGLMAGIVIKIMAYITARSDITSGTLKARAKPKKTSARDWWRPWIIGSQYVRSRKYTGGGDHASPSMHWRSGHWRNQAVGPRAEDKHKLIWIEPILVGGKNEHG